MVTTKNDKSKRLLIIVLAVFFLPVVLAKLALTFQWFDYGVTNHGQLLEEQQTIVDLGLDQNTFSEQWLLIYHPPAQCLTNCQQALHILNSTYILLGKETPRVTPIVLSQRQLTQQQKQVFHHQKWQFLKPSSAMNQAMEDNQIIIADPMGNLVMTHKVPIGEENIQVMAKAILADMKKLLKYSKIG
ncbi:hypothetical protein [Thalassotalea marina]|uniref:Cytochrome oxidase biogenesis cluster protein n=1 Tax=Thalassotalea marina TaxID=1673741 RepID=A0A919BN75_9GAMM|nr:hypothetical protein [Thalassotalea marina]GHF99711.1 hypothetical protein GCM10017161_30260 [Thalassotalea marina]